MILSDMARAASESNDRIYPQPFVCTVTEAAHLVGVGRTTMFALLRSGQIRSIRIGRLVRIPMTEIENFIAARLDEDQ